MAPPPPPPRRRSVGALRRGAAAAAPPPRRSSSVSGDGAASGGRAPSRRKRVSFDLARNTSHPAAPGAPPAAAARGSAFAAFAKTLQAQPRAGSGTEHATPPPDATTWDWRRAPPAGGAAATAATHATGGEDAHGGERGVATGATPAAAGTAAARDQAGGNDGADRVERELLAGTRAGDEELDFDSLYSELNPTHGPVFWQDATPPPPLDGAAAHARGTQPWLLEQLARRAGTSAESAMARVWSRVRRHAAPPSPTSPTATRGELEDAAAPSWVSLGVGVAAVFACNAVWELAFPDMRLVFTDQLDDIHREADVFF